MSEIDFDAIFAELPDKPLLRVEEVALFMGVTKRTIYGWYPEKLQGTNVSGVLRIYRTSVVAMVKINTGRQNSTECSSEISDKLIPEHNKPHARRIQSRSSWVKRW